jgi:stage II sporulation protein AA (anti-sigma F factor antagonist)
MEIKARQKGHTIILDLFGRLDVDSANLVQIVGQCLMDGYTDILCNLESVEFIDYMGISALVLAYKEIINNKGRMKLANIPLHLKNIFSVAGLERTIDMYLSEEAALASFQEDQIIEKIKKLQLRRRFKRLPIEMKIELKTKYGKNPVCLKADVCNISGVGAYIYGCSQFKLGDDLILKFKLPPKKEELELEANVVWLPDKQVQPQQYPGIGVEFSHIRTDAQQKLLDFIERNLSRWTTDREE